MLGGTGFLPEYEADIVSEESMGVAASLACSHVKGKRCEGSTTVGLMGEPGKRNTVASGRFLLARFFLDAGVG